MESRSGGSVEKKYKTLKRKCKSLSDDVYNLTDELTQSKKRIARLLKERTFLLDRLLKFEQVSSDSDGVPSPLSSDEERPKKREKKDVPQVRTKRAYNMNKDENVQMCVGKGKDDRPCKSKALPGFKYCWHHAPLDPNSPFVFCEYVDATKRNPRKCSIPVAKEKKLPYCNYHVKRIAPEMADLKQENGDGLDVEVEVDDDGSSVEDNFDDDNGKSPPTEPHFRTA